MVFFLIISIPLFLMVWVNILFSDYNGKDIVYIFFRGSLNAILFLILRILFILFIPLPVRGFSLFLYHGVVNFIVPFLPLAMEEFYRIFRDTVEEKRKEVAGVAFGFGYMFLFALSDVFLYIHWYDSFVLIFHPLMRLALIVSIPAIITMCNRNGMDNFFVAMGITLGILLVVTLVPFFYYAHYNITSIVLSSIFFVALPVLSFWIIQENLTSPIIKKAT